jgi:hypothetical protein
VKLENILKESKEYKNRQYHKKISTCCVQPAFKNVYKQELFHVVISRLDEDPGFIEHFDAYPCKVFLYNRGDVIQHAFKSSKIHIIDIPNIGHTDYAYLSHIVANYYNLKCPLVFFNDLTKCPEIFKILDNFEKFSNFESLTQTSLYKLPSQKSEYNTIKCQNNINAFNQDTLESLMEVFGVKINKGIEFVRERYAKAKLAPFVPHVHMYIHHSLIKNHCFEMYKMMKGDIETIHKVCKWKSKCFSVLLERFFWSSVW